MPPTHKRLGSPGMNPSQMPRVFTHKETEAQKGWKTAPGQMGKPARNPDSEVFLELRKGHSH